MSSPVAKALWGHYKRHPFQIVLVWLGLTLGIALLVGVMGVNQQARESYRQGEQLFFPIPFRIEFVITSQRLKYRRASIFSFAERALTNVYRWISTGLLLTKIEILRLSALIPLPCFRTSKIR